MSRIGDAFNAFVNGMPDPPKGEEAKTDPLAYFGDDNTPYNPDELITRRGMKTLEAMRNDDQIKAAMSFKKHAVLVGGWEVVSPKDEKADWEVTEFVDWNLRHLASTSDTFEEALYAVLSALDFGYSCSELVWDTADTQFGNRAVLTAIKSKQPQPFDFKVDPYGNLEYLLQQDGDYTGDGYGKKLDPEKFVIYSYNKEFGNFYGRSDLVAAYRSYWVKNNVYKWMAMYLERLGVPPVFALYDPTSYNKKQKDDLKSVIMNFQAATSGIIPRPARPDAKADDVLSFWTPELAAQIRDVFVPVIEMLNNDMSRALLMPGLLGFTPDGGAGSYARAEKHFDAFLMINNYLRQRISTRVVQEQIVKRIVDYNYPNIGEYPQFQFLPMTDDVQLDLLTTWKELVEKRVVVAQGADEDHIRSLFKFPERDPDRPEPEVDEPDALPTEDEEAGDIESESGSDEDNEDINPDDELAKLLSASPNDEHDNPPHFISPLYDPALSDHSHSHDALGGADRSFAEGELRIDFKQVERDLDKLETETEKQLVPVFLGVRDDLIKFVTRNWEKNIGAKMKDYRLRGIAQVRSTMRDLLQTSLRFGMENVQKELSKVKPTKQFASIGLTPAQAVRWLDQWEDFFVSGVIKEDLTKGAQLIIANAIKNGDTLAETQAALGGLFEPFIGNPNIIRDGKAVVPARLQTIIRTNTTNAFNQGRLIESRQNDDLVQGVQYSAILDSRTTEICRFLHGKRYRLDDPALDNIVPPNHFSCRSILVPITITEKLTDKDWVTSAQKGKASDLIDPKFGGAPSAAPLPKG